jgi:hypothetical protein
MKLSTEVRTVSQVRRNADELFPTPKLWWSSYSRAVIRSQEYDVPRSTSLKKNILFYTQDTQRTQEQLNQKAMKKKQERMSRLVR